MILQTFSTSLKTRSGERGFTMIEIALSLAIVAFALVAIMGVLPAGMNVQKDNREDTLMKSEAQYFLDAIRSGSRGIDELTNYVEEVSHQRVNSAGLRTTNGIWTDLSGEQIIGALLVTKQTSTATLNVYNTNSAFARVRPINGSAAEKVDRKRTDAVFRYQVEAELVPVDSRMGTMRFNKTNYSSVFDPGSFTNNLYNFSLAQSLYELRVTVRWPVFEKGAGWAVGNGRKTLSTLVGGTLYQTNYPKFTPPLGNLFFQPNQF